MDLFFNILKGSLEGRKIFRYRLKENAWDRSIDMSDLEIEFHENKIKKAV